MKHQEFKHVILRRCVSQLLVTKRTYPIPARMSGCEGNADTANSVSVLDL